MAVIFALKDFVDVIILLFKIHFKRVLQLILLLIYFGI